MSKITTKQKEFDLNNIPDQLKEGRDITEGNFVFSLYKNPELISEHKNVVPGVDIFTPDALFYFTLIQGLTMNGYTEATDHSIATFVETRPSLKKEYDKRGGYQSIKEATDSLDAEHYDKYYDNLVKSNLMFRLYQRGFPILQDFNKLINLDAEGVYDYYSLVLSDTSIGKIEKVKVEDLSVGNDAWIEEIDKGVLRGFPIDSPIINYMLAGIHPDNLTLHIAGIGQGKTTSAILLYVFSMIKHSDVTIISNEQGASEFRSMIVSSAVFNKVKGGVKGLNRQKFVTGGFTPEQKDKIHEANEWLASQPGHIRFVEMRDYDVINIKKVITKQSKLGCNLFIVDTIKPLNEMDERAWAQFSEVAKTLFLLAKQTHTAIICTAQASAESLGRKYMDLSSIAKSRAIAETATQVIGFRPLFPDEVDKIKPYNWRSDEGNPGAEKIKTPTDLDPEKHYVMFYIMKNRFGPTMPQVVCEFDQAFCRLKEVGYYISDYAPQRGR